MSTFWSCWLRDHRVFLLKPPDGVKELVSKDLCEFGLTQKFAGFLYTNDWSGPEECEDTQCLHRFKKADGTRLYIWEDSKDTLLIPKEIGEIDRKVLQIIHDKLIPC